MLQESHAGAAGQRDCVEAARTTLLPMQPLPDSAGGCWKEVKPVGFRSLEAAGCPYKEAETGMEEGPRVTVVPPHLHRVLGMGTGLGSSATPEWEWEAGS